MENISHAFVLLSGGIDSTTCLMVAIRDVGVKNVHAISVDYGQRHKKEMQCAQEICEGLGVDHQVVTLSGVPKVMLTDAGADVPNVSYADLPAGVSPTYVPFRNGQLLSKIAGLAEHYVEGLNRGKATTQQHNTAQIYFGAHAEDAAGDAYPDCRFDFVGAMAAAVWIGTYGLVRVKAPLIERYKDEIVRWGHSLGAPFHKTWSCYKGEELHCGTCPTCRARKEGFRKTGITDPTQYKE